VAAGRRRRRWVALAGYSAAAAAAATVITVVLVSDRGGDSMETAAVTTISGVADYRTSDPAALTRNHKQGKQTYRQSPPVGGDHNPVWQNCTGTVYDAPIADEHAVHSLEHGAVWITYRPGLAADQIHALASKVRGVDYTFLSPYPGLDTPISVQAWGYQLKVDTAADPRLDQFITATRITAGPEPGATCTGGITATGTTPQDTTGTGMQQRG
jgi:hypothetical protein